MHKYNQLGLHNVLYMYFFKDDHLLMDNQWYAPPWGRLLLLFSTLLNCQ